MKLRSTVLLSLLLITLSIFGQGTVYGPGPSAVYQVTYPVTGSGTNSTTLIAGSGVTLVTNAANNFTISASGATFDTNAYANSLFRLVDTNAYANSLFRRADTNAFASSLKSLSLALTDTNTFANSLFRTADTNAFAASLARIVGPSFSGGVSIAGGLLTDTETASGAVQLNGTLQITGGSPAAGKVWTGSDGVGNGSWQPATGGSPGGGGTNMVPTALSYSGGTNVALVGTLPTGSIGPIRYKLTMTTNTFLQVPSGSPVDQATMVIVINQDAVGTWSYLHDTNSAGGFGMSIVDLPLPLPNSTNALSTDVVGYIYLAARNKWFVTSHVRSLQ